jgi:hypothetical protein
MVKIRNVDQKWIDVNLCTEEYIKKMQDRHGEGKMVNN